MKILWITLESILPCNTGGRIGVFKRLEQISKNDEIFLFYPYDKEEELTQIKELKKYCKKVYPYSRKDNKIHALLNVFKYPYTVGSREILKMKSDIRKCIIEDNIDVVNVDFPHMCVNLLGLDINIPIILNEHNIEWKVYKNIAKSHKNVIKKMLYFIDSFRLFFYEKKIFQKINFSQITFVSDKDMDYMIEKKIVDANKAILIPVGADINSIINKEHSDKNIIFVGKMSYGPNIEAVKWFVNDIFKKIENDIPNVKFLIVGKDPTSEVKKLERNNIIVTGFVKSVEEYYNIADLVVLPLKNGGGVKVKLLEAISYRKPIVSTNIGVEGTYFKESLIPVADDADTFSRICIDILKNNYKYKYNQIDTCFIENYTWDGIGKKYREMIRKLL
ncbi:MAG: glycosyltransferase [Clostridia bacterium]|nr:glycosyltransferase [Clostridia bacterium]